jgi:hypothetical protein
MSCPAQDRGLSKGIKYSYTLFGVGEAAGDALSTAQKALCHAMIFGAMIYLII